jgi:RES domain-containing protein
MITAWRIVKKRYSATAFDGEGARLNGGRWNSIGTRMIYTSGSLSLAILENLVHLNPPVTFAYVAFRIDFADSILTTLKPTDLPPHWNAEPTTPATQHLGDQWIQQANTAILAVPSAIVPTETNYLLNPTHPAFKKIKIHKPMPYSWDQRLL